MRAPGDPRRLDGDRSRLALLEDTVRALPILLGPGGRRFEGDVITVPETALYPRPIQERVPMYHRVDR